MDGFDLLDAIADMPKHACMLLLDADDFVNARPPVALGDDEIHLWLCDHAAGANDTDDAVRDLLAAYLDVEREVVETARDVHGKPFLARPAAADLQFNLSHSGTRLIVALARSQPVGIDIERATRARPWLALAKRFFTAGEYETLAVLSPDRLSAAFIELWSCKEAVVKALGRGIAFGLDRLAFRWHPHGELAGLASIDAEAGALEDWHVVRLQPASGFLGAIAWRGAHRKLRAFTLDRAAFSQAASREAAFRQSM